jgi:hypothetical protein
MNYFLVKVSGIIKIKVYLVIFLLYLIAPTSTYSAITHKNSKQVHNEIVNRALKLELWKDHYWKILLHYKNSIFGWESEIDDPSFFLAIKGKSNPKSELIATLDLFLGQQSPEKKKSQCKYVARFFWLKKRLQLNQQVLPNLSCPKFQKWIDEINPSAITLIFPTYDLTAAGSMFGHTLLRIDSKNFESNLLLSQAINYAAIIYENENHLSYVLKGLSGGFKGVFGSSSYYLKVQEYNHLDVRDIWEYNLSLTEEEIKKMLMHVWELGFIYFDYFFLKENCSYQLLSLLEAARPELDLQDQFNLWVIPSDTVRVVQSIPGLVKDRFYRPSRLSRIKQKMTDFSEYQQQLFEDMFTKQQLKLPLGWKELPLIDKAILLETISEGLILLKDADNKIEIEKYRLDVLKERAKLDIVLREKEYTSISDPPEEGHDTSKIGVGFGNDSTDQQYIELEYRMSFHSFMDHELGYYKNATIEFGKLSARFYEDLYYLENFTIVHAMSLVPIDLFMSHLSWRMYSGIEHISLNGFIEDEYRWKNTGGVGVSYELGAFLIYLIPQFEYSYSPYYKKKYQAGFVLLSGITFDMSNQIKIHLEGSAADLKYGDKQQYRKAFIQSRYSINKNNDLRIEYLLQEELAEIQLTYTYHF